jgi:hypothetical protein
VRGEQLSAVFFLVRVGLRDGSMRQSASTSNACRVLAIKAAMPPVTSRTFAEELQISSPLRNGCCTSVNTRRLLLLEHLHGPCQYYVINCIARESGMKTFAECLIPSPNSRLQRYPKLRFPGYTIRQHDILS